MCPNILESVTKTAKHEDVNQDHFLSHLAVLSFLGLSYFFEYILHHFLQSSNLFLVVTVVNILLNRMSSPVEKPGGVMSTYVYLNHTFNGEINF